MYFRVHIFQNCISYAKNFVLLFSVMNLFAKLAIIVSLLYFAYYQQRTCVELRVFKGYLSNEYHIILFKDGDHYFLKTTKHVHQIVTYIQVNFIKTTIFNNYIVFFYHYHHEANLFLHLRSLTPNKNSKQRQFSIIPMARGLLSFMYYFTFILLLSGDIELNPGPTRREEFTSLLDEKQSD